MKQFDLVQTYSAGAGQNNLKAVKLATTDACSIIMSPVKIF